MFRKGILFVFLLAFMLPLISSAASGSGALEGRVVNADNGFGVYGAQVQAKAGNVETTITTDADGHFLFNSLPPGQYHVTVLKSGFNRGNDSVKIHDGDRVSVTISLKPIHSTGTLSGTVYDENDQPLSGAAMTISGVALLTNANGFYSINLLGGSNHTISVTVPGFETYLESGIVVVVGTTTTHDIHLVPLAWVFPGAHQYGDSGSCDGVITVDDLNMMITAMKGLPTDYSGCFPNDKMIQDLSGDSFIGPNDWSILNSWLKGIFSPNPWGWPDTINFVTPAAATVPAGASLDLAVSVQNSFNSWTNSVGWGVVFEIDEAASTCSTAYLYGRPYPVTWHYGKSYREESPAAFEYSGSDGVVQVPLSAYGCAPGTVISVNVFIPGDAEADNGSGLIWGSRFPNTFTSPTSFLVTVQ